jgi:hypothetical protein
VLRGSSLPGLLLLPVPRFRLDIVWLFALAAISGAGMQSQVIARCLENWNESSSPIALAFCCNRLSIHHNGIGSSSRGPGFIFWPGFISG